MAGKCTGLAVECTKVFQQTQAHKQVHLRIEMHILSAMCGEEREENSKENRGKIKECTDEMFMKTSRRTFFQNKNFFPHILFKIHHFLIPNIFVITLFVNFNP